MTEGVEVLSVVERLGGWGVVVWIVVWLTKRWEARMDALNQAVLAQSAALSAQTQVIMTIAHNLEMLRSFSAEATSGVTDRLERVGDVLEQVSKKLNAA